MNTNKEELQTRFLTFSEACDILEVSRADLHDFIKQGEVEAVTTLDRQIWIVCGGALYSPFNEIHEFHHSLNPKDGKE